VRPTVRCRREGLSQGRGQAGRDRVIGGTVFLGRSGQGLEARQDEEDGGDHIHSCHSVD